MLANELSPRGRLGRRGFWLRHLMVVPWLLWACTVAKDAFGAPFDLPVVLILVVVLVSIWSRRLHDRGRSALWLLAVLVPVVGAVFLIVECGLGAGVVDDIEPGAGSRTGYLTVGAPNGEAPSLR